MNDVVISPATKEDMPEVARVFRTSRLHSLPNLPQLHTPEEDVRYFSEVMFPHNRVFVARTQASGAIIGFIAFKDEWVNHLYLLPAAQGQGVESRLLRMAQRQSRRLRLWTFQRNVPAIQFYEKNGFQIIKRTDGSENEEREPDAMMEWNMSEGRVQDKVVLLTGAGSGIGRATAVLLAREKATVIVLDANGEAARLTVEQISGQGGRAEAVTADVAEEAAWQAVTDGIMSRHGRLDVLVNNAGVSFAKPVVHMSLAEWHRVMAVNLDGVFLGTKHGIIAMKRSGGGSIINVASVSGLTPSAGASAYCAGKAAVRMFSKVAALECAGTGVRVNLVTPGGVKTPMWESMDFFRDLIAQHGDTEQAFAAMAGPAPSAQFYSAEEVARTILYLASDESSHLTGVEMVMDRGNTG